MESFNSKNKNNLKLRGWNTDQTKMQQNCHINNDLMQPVPSQRRQLRSSVGSELSHSEAQSCDVTKNEIFMKTELSDTLTCSDTDGSSDEDKLIKKIKIHNFELFLLSSASSASSASDNEKRQTRRGRPLKSKRGRKSKGVSFINNSNQNAPIVAPLITRNIEKETENSVKNCLVNNRRVDKIQIINDIKINTVSPVVTTSVATTTLDHFANYLPGDAVAPLLPYRYFLASSLEADCVGVGTKHQAVKEFSQSKNLSCTVMATTAICHKELTGKLTLQTDEIDQILVEGNRIYLNHVRGEARLLDPEELPSQMQYNSKRFTISANWVDSGLYPNRENDFDDIIKRIHRALKVCNDAQGFLFTGLDYTVSFWVKMNSSGLNYTLSSKNDRRLLVDIESIYVFNSHACDTTGVRSLIDNSVNFARLFKVYNLKSLSKLLLKYGENCIKDGNPENKQFSIYSIHTQTCDTFNTFSNNAQRELIANQDNFVGSVDTSLLLPTTAILGEPLPAKCIATGSKHQGIAFFPRSNNLSCVANSAVALCYKHAVNENFDSQDIDAILEIGESFYYEEIVMKILSNKEPDIIEPEQLPNEIIVNNIVFNISTPEWIDNGTYPPSFDSQSKQFNVNDMVLRLHRALALNRSANGLLFTGCVQTIAFWPLENNDTSNMSLDQNLICNATGYHVFNSHSVDETGRNVSSSKARLFHVSNLKSLALLLSKTADDQVANSIQYSLHAFNVTAVTSMTMDDMIDTTLLSQSTASSIESANKRGRKNKITRGQIKTKENSHLEAVKKYQLKQPQVNRDAVKKYQLKQPQVNRDAVKKYQLKQPQVNRDSVKKYQLKQPQVNRDAVKKYQFKHPQVHRDAVKKYMSENTNINRASSQLYRENNSHVIQQAEKTYNRQRMIEPHLRNAGLIAEKTGESLAEINLYNLLKTSLRDESISVCQFCTARLFVEERARKMWCCSQGKSIVRQFEDITSQNFYRNPVFLKRIRAYNNLFAFSALGVSHGFQHPNNGVAFIKIQGRTYHRVFDLSYTATYNPIAMYINDSNERTNIGMERELNRDLVNAITSYLEEVNPFINEFRRLSLEPSREAHIIFEHTSRRTHGNILGDMPRGSEIAALISNEVEEYVPKHIAIWKIGEARPHTVNIFHPLYESFQYPLLYPHGGSGWCKDTLQAENAVQITQVDVEPVSGEESGQGEQTISSSKKLTQIKYYRRLILAEDRFAYLGRLSEEWMVDMYSRVEEERLEFNASMQRRHGNMNELRIASRDEIAQDIARDETIQGDDGRPLPGKIYLPNKFTGGPRFMRTKYMDAIAIVNRLGKPSYFLTMTCNTKWPEIIENTPAHLNAPPAICARVFQLKLQNLLQNLRSGQWFGQCVYIIHVIEFQKRGLPHAHIIFRVEGGGPTQNIDIDRVVRADIPSDSEGRLRDLVLKHMIHGPCGPFNRTDLPCWDSEKNRCSKRFPKKHTNVTHIDERGFINLKRNAENIAAIIYRNREVPISDLYVVPYNAALLLKYDCHMNLEIASTRKVIKYLFKYITKGPDEARVSVVPEEHLNNEIETYVTKRYIGACEAAWRIFEFDIHGREPTVNQLHVHLEGQNSVFFRVGQETQAIANAKSDLTVYFNRPEGPEFDTITYQQFYEQYIVHTARPKTQSVPIHTIHVANKDIYITKRQRGRSVARLFWVAPKHGEQFYLRLLLASFPCRGYSDLKSLGGPNCNTFQEAARALGIANDEEEYATCLKEASTFFTAKKLRNFFVLLITNGAPGAILWNEFKNNLSEDFLERHLNDEDEALKMSLLEIERLLRRHGSSLENQGLPSVQDETTEYTRELTLHNHGRLESYHSEWLPLLSQEQRAVYDYVRQLLNDGNCNISNTIFIDGPSGTGKTLLLNLIVSYVRGVLNKVAICTASSGIAALNYEGGTTAHSMFKFPFEVIDDTAVWSITNGSQRGELLYKAALIIYDEAPMTHKHLIHILDRSLKDLMNSTKPFGGKVMIFAGDFRQIPPVIINTKCQHDIYMASLKTSPLYRDMKKFKLITAQRTRGDQDYSEFLLNLGSGLLPSEINLSHIDYVTELTDLINFVFPENTINQPDICAERAILSTHLQNVHEINSCILDRIEGDDIHCYSVDNVSNEHSDDFYHGIDVLQNVQARGVPDYDLKLKKGCIAMIIRNLSFTDRLVNGTKVIIEDISPRLIRVRKPSQSEIFLIPRITFVFPIEPNSPIEMSRKQFPLQLAYAMTIHKSQGQTIDRVGVDLRSDVFSHGQLYVALGRVRNKENTKNLINEHRLIEGTTPYINNVVISELLNN